MMQLEWNLSTPLNYDAHHFNHLFSLNYYRIFIISIQFKWKRELVLAVLESSLISATSTQKTSIYLIRESKNVNWIFSYYLWLICTTKIFIGLTTIRLLNIINKTFDKKNHFQVRDRFCMVEFFIVNTIFLNK